jgi:hypothetical protein
VIAYLAGLSRWCGVFEIKGPMYRDSEPLFCVRKDAFVLRYPISARVVLDPASAIPIDVLWGRLNRTKNMSRDTPGWAVKAGMIGSLGTIDASDGELLVRTLLEQVSASLVFDLTHQQKLRIRRDAEKRRKELEEESAMKMRSLATR